MICSVTLTIIEIKFQDKTSLGEGQGFGFLTGVLNLSPEIFYFLYYVGLYVFTLYQKFSFILKKFFFFLFIWLFCPQVCLCIICPQCLWGPEEGTGAPEIPVTDAVNHCARAENLTSVLWKSVQLVLLSGSCFPAQVNIRLLVPLYLPKYAGMNPCSQHGNSYVYKM